jgi:two-component system phosphate regulon sensor histidine kinase PhoR
VSNAVRYNREGGTVSVGLEDRGDRIRLTVADEGIGVAAEDRDRIFEEFYRTDEARRLSNLGTGLGLSIVKRFVEDLGGGIRVTGAADTGSTFEVTLPRRFVPAGAEQGGRA